MKPMSAERLAEIHSRWQHVKTDENPEITVTRSSTPGSLMNALSSAHVDVPAILAEVDRLHAEAIDRQEVADDVDTEATVWHDEYQKLRAQMAIVTEFLAERAEFVTTLRQCVDANADYHRWQGRAEARSVLSERLGLPVAWPAKGKQNGGES